MLNTVKTSPWIGHTVCSKTLIRRPFKTWTAPGKPFSSCSACGVVEELASDNRGLREENQRLRDENNRLKGEQGKPQIRPNRAATPSASQNHSSERERHKPQAARLRLAEAWTKTSKVERIKINRAEVVQVDRAVLPADAEFKGYDEVIVQDIEFKTDNVLFRKEKFYSKMTRETYTAQLPKGYTGQFGPGLKALTIVLYHGSTEGLG